MKAPKIYSNFRLREIIEEYIHSERDRKILIRKYCDKRTVFQLAEEFELSDTQINRIITRDGIIIFGILAKDEKKME